MTSSRSPQQKSEFSYNYNDSMKRLPIFLTLWLLTFATPLLAAPTLRVKTSCAYMPYGNNASQIIYVTNPSAEAVKVIATAFDDAGTEYDLGEVATVPSKTVSSLRSTLKNALEAQGFNDGIIAYELALTNSAAHAYFGYTLGTEVAYVAPHRELSPLPAQSVSTPTPNLRITFPHMFYDSGNGYSASIYIANPSRMASGINVTAYDNAGNTYDLGDLNSMLIPARRVTNLSNALQVKLQQESFSGSGTVTFIMEFSNPEIMAHSAINWRSDKLYVAPIRELYIP